MEVGVRVHLRDVETLDDVDDVTAPAQVEPGDLVASADEVWRVEVVLVTGSGRKPVEPVLARRLVRPRGHDLSRGEARKDMLWDIMRVKNAADISEIPAFMLYM